MYDKLIKRIGGRFGVEPALIKAVIKRESNFKANAKRKEYKTVKKKKKYIGTSYGLMQVLDTTAAMFGIKNPELLLNPAIGIEIGTRYLKDCMKKFNILQEFIASYNAVRVKLRSD